MTSSISVSLQSTSGSSIQISVSSQPSPAPALFRTPATSTTALIAPGIILGPSPSPSLVQFPPTIFTREIPGSGRGMPARTGLSHGHGPGFYIPTGTGITTTFLSPSLEPREMKSPVSPIFPPPPTFGRHREFPGSGSARR